MLLYFVPLTTGFLSLQILDSQDFQEFPAKPLDSLQNKDSSLINTSQGQLVPYGLDSLGQHLELELGLGGASGAVDISGPGVSSGLGLESESRATVGSSLGAGLVFGSGACIRAGSGTSDGSGTSALNADTQRRLSLQEPQTPLDSRTPERHSSDPGGS